MNQIVGILALAALGLLMGCDPGFTVREARPRLQHHLAPSVATSELSVDVDRFHTLAGDSVYRPKIRISNMSKLPIAVTEIQLISRVGVYVGSINRSGPDSSPRSLMTIDPGATGELDIWFDLNHGLDTIFRKPADLQVQYTIGDISNTAKVRLVGKTEAGNAP